MIFISLYIVLLVFDFTKPFELKPDLVSKLLLFLPLYNLFYLSIEGLRQKSHAGRKKKGNKYKKMGATPVCLAKLAGACRCPLSFYESNGFIDTLTKGALGGSPVMVKPGSHVAYTQCWE